MLFLEWLLLYSKHEQPQINMSRFLRWVTFIWLLFLAHPVFAAAPVTAGRYGLNDPLGGVGIPALIGGLIRYALGIVGALFLLFFMYAGFLWMSAGGDAKRVQKSKDAIVHAVLGIVVVMLSYALVSFIIGLSNQFQGA